MHVFANGQSVPLRRPIRRHAADEVTQSFQTLLKMSATFAPPKPLLFLSTNLGAVNSVFGRIRKPLAGWIKLRDVR